MNTTERTCMKALGRPNRPLYFYSEEEGYQGIAILLLEEIARHFNICYTIKHTRGMPYGAFNETTETFSGTLGIVQRKESDMLIAMLFFDDKRAKYFDPSNYIAISSMTAITAFPKLGPDYLGFVKAFADEVWVAIALACFFAFLILLFFNVFRQNHLEPSREESIDDISDEPVPSGHVGKSFFDIWKPLLGQGINIKNNRPTISLFVGFWIITTLLLNVSYKCNLKAALIIPRVDVPFNNYEEMLAQDKVQWLMMKGTVFRSVAQNSPEGSILKRISDGSVVITDTLKAIPSIESGERTLLLNDLNSMGIILKSFLMRGKCSTSLMKETYWARPMFIAFQKGSKYRHLFNAVYIRLVEAGIFQHWMNDVMKDAIPCVQNAGKVGTTLRPFVLEDVFGVFCILFGGLAASILAFFCELLMPGFAKNKVKK